MTRAELEKLYRMTEQLQAEDNMSALIPCWKNACGGQMYATHEQAFKLFQTIIHQHIQVSQ